MNDSLLWFIISIILITIEVFAPGVIVVFFAFGALIVSILELFFDFPFVWESGIFTVSSLLSLGILRDKFKEALYRRKQNRLESDDYVGKKVEVIEDIVDGKIGLVELHGSNWKAISEDNLSRGDEAIIIERDNITLKVAKIDFK